MNDSEKYGQSVVDAFNLASTLLWAEEMTPNKFIRAATDLQRLTKTKPPADFWKGWPMQPTTFPLYMRAGYSALDVARQFSDSINSCIQVAKVESVGMPKDYSALNDEQKSNWMKAALSRVAGICSKSDAVERFRERDLLRLKLQIEFNTWSEGKPRGKPSGIQPREPKPGKRKQKSRWADATKEFLSQHKGPTEFARDWANANPRRINSLRQEFGTIEKAVARLGNALSKARKLPK